MVVVDGLFGGKHGLGRGYRLSRAEVAVPAWVCPTGHLNADAVATPETVRGRPHVDFEL